MKSKNKSLIISTVLILFLLAGFGYYAEGSLPVDKNDTQNRLFVIEQGQGLNAIAQDLEKEGFIRNKIVFILVVKQLGIEKNIQAGDYRLQRSLSSTELAKSLTKGSLDQWFTIIEGLRKEEIADLVTEKLGIPSADFLAVAQEGYLFPDTYLIPHLLQEVIVDPDKIINALKWTVGEMQTRYEILAKVHAKNLESYNVIPNIEKKPYIIFIIDELATLMMHARGEAEDLITKIAQMARAVGIHLVLATQRPSVDVITGLMKANIPTRVAFNVSSLVDSRVVIDTPGAEKLLGKGDMLYLPPDQAKPRRIQGPYVTESEVHELVSFLRNQNPVVNYTTEVTEPTDTYKSGGLPTVGGGSSNLDPYFNQALDLVNQSDKASASLLQRKLKVGYARAARILDELQEAGYVGVAEGSKPREILRRGAVNTEEVQHSE